MNRINPSKFFACVVLTALGALPLCSQPVSLIKFGMVGAIFGQTLRLSVVGSDPQAATCVAQLGFAGSNGAPVGSTKSVNLSPGHADFLDLDASSLTQQFGQRVELRPVVTLLPPATVATSACNATLELFDNSTGFSMLLIPGVAVTTNSTLTEFGLIGLVQQQKLRLNVVALSSQAPGNCIAQLSFVDANNNAAGPAPKNVNLSPGTADFLDTATPQLVTPRTELRPVVTVPQPNAPSSCFATAEVYDLSSGRTWSWIMPSQVSSTAGPGTSITLTGGGQSTKVGTAFLNQFVVTVKDALSNPVAGVPVQLTGPVSGASAIFAPVGSASTNAQGQVTFTGTANSTAGTYTITATATGVPGSATGQLTNIAGPGTTITLTGGGQSAPVGTVFANQFVVTVKDALSNPVAGVPVQLTGPVSGASATFAPVGSASTNAQGQVTFTGTANATVGTYTITATATGVPGSATGQLTNTAVGQSTITLTGGGQSAVVGTAFANSFVVTVKDALSNPLANVPVQLTGPGSGASATFAPVGSASTNAQGQVTFTGTANAIAGTYTITATATGVPGSATGQLTNTAAPPSNPLIIDTNSLTSGQVGAFYSQPLAAHGGTPPYQWTGTGLPDGLAVNSDRQIIRGTPTTSGMYNVTLTVMDSTAQTASVTLVLVIQ